MKQSLRKPARKHSVLHQSILALHICQYKNVFFHLALLKGADLIHEAQDQQAIPEELA